MDNPIRQAFASIKAEEALKFQTLSAIYAKGRKANKLRRGGYRRKMTFVVASFLLLFVAGSISISMYHAPAASIAIDTNPALELTVNRFDRVVGVDTYNADGVRLIEGIGLKYEKYNEALERIVAALILKGYLLPESVLSVTVQSGDEKREGLLMAELQESSKAAMKAQHCQSKVEIYAISREILEHAHDLQLSPAKYLAITELQKIDANVTVEGCRNHTVQELRELVREKDINYSQKKQCQTGYKEGHGHSH